jgi:hypothetical protein
MPDNPSLRSTEGRIQRCSDRCLPILPGRHFSFICSKELVDKVQSIARKEGFTIRSFMEYVMKQGVEAYESKYGKVKKIRTKTIREVM